MINFYLKILNFCNKNKSYKYNKLKAWNINLKEVTSKTGTFKIIIF